jgi:hypothetical protein
MTALISSYRPYREGCGTSRPFGLEHHQTGIGMQSFDTYDKQNVCSEGIEPPLGESM